MSRVLVIGYGNPLRGDDGLGWRVVEQLEALEDEAITVLACHQLTPELVQPVGEADLVLFVDATVEGIPGTLTSQYIDPDAPTSIVSTSLTHEVYPSVLLVLSRMLYGSTPVAFLLSITGATFEYSDELSPEVQQRLPHLMARLSQLINEQIGIQERRYQHA